MGKKYPILTNKMGWHINVDFEQLADSYPELSIDVATDIFNSGLRVARDFDRHDAIITVRKILEKHQIENAKRKALTIVRTIRTQ